METFISETALRASEKMRFARFISSFSPSFFSFPPPLHSLQPDSISIKNDSLGAIFEIMFRGNSVGNEIERRKLKKKGQQNRVEFSIRGI